MIRSKRILWFIRFSRPEVGRLRKVRSLCSSSNKRGTPRSSSPSVRSSRGRDRRDGDDERGSPEPFGTQTFRGRQHLSTRESNEPKKRRFRTRGRSVPTNLTNRGTPVVSCSKDNKSSRSRSWQGLPDGRSTMRMLEVWGLLAFGACDLANQCRSVSGASADTSYARGGASVGGGRQRGSGPVYDISKFVCFLRIAFNTLEPGGFSLNAQARRSSMPIVFEF